MSAKLQRVFWAVAACTLSISGLLAEPTGLFGEEAQAAPGAEPQIETTAAAVDPQHNPPITAAQIAGREYFFASTQIQSNADSNADSSAGQGGVEEGEYQILQGVPASGTTEWVAYIPITNHDGTGAICTGVLVDPSWVLTARHCLANGPRYINVSFGGNRIGKYAVDDYKLHESHDAALLHLKTAVTGIVPARLADQAPSIGAVGAEYGWGGNGNQMLIAQQRIVANCYTQVGMSDASRFTAKCDGTQAEGQLSFKTQWPGVMTEHGDSGGPLLVNGQVVATLIGGNKDAAYFGSVLPLADWLYNTAKVSLGKISMELVEYPYESRVPRIGGETRVDTALALQGASGASGDAVVLTTGRLAPDALGSAALVGARGATILLTMTDPVESKVLDAIMYSGRKQVYVVGGGVKLSSAQISQLEAAGIKVTKLVGQTRFETARNVALEAVEQSPKSGNLEVYLVDATTDANIPDAIAAGPAVAKRHGVILYTAGRQLPPATIQALTQLRDLVRSQGRGLRVRAVGGSAAAALAGAGLSAQDLGGNLVGATRYETAVQVVQALQPEAKDFLVASGVLFPDGLAGAGYAYATNKAILLSAPNQMVPALQHFVAEHPQAGYTIAGGSVAISRFVANSIGIMLVR